MKLGVLCVAFALPLVGCDTQSMPPNRYTPDVVGIIERIEEPGVNDPVDDRVVVGDEVIEIMKDGSPAKLRGTLVEGSLLIYGDEGDDAWYFIASRSEAGFNAGCYVIDSNTAFDQADRVLIEVDESVGMWFVKSADFEPEYTPDPSTGRYPEWQKSWCLNEHGELLRAE